MDSRCVRRKPTESDQLIRPHKRNLLFALTLINFAHVDTHVDSSRISLQNIPLQFLRECSWTDPFSHRTYSQPLIFARKAMNGGKALQARPWLAFSLSTHTDSFILVLYCPALKEKNSYLFTSEMSYFPSPMPSHDVAAIINHSIVDLLAIFFNLILLLAVKLK